MRPLILLIMVSLLAFAATGCAPKAKTRVSTAPAVKESVAVPLADGFPDDFPLIEGTVTASMVTKSSDESGTAVVGKSYYTQVRTSLTQADAMAFYKGRFTKLTRQEPGGKGTPALYAGFVGRHPVSIYFNDREGGTMVTILLSAK